MYIVTDIWLFVLSRGIVFRVTVAVPSFQKSGGNSIIVFLPSATTIDYTAFNAMTLELLFWRVIVILNRRVFPDGFLHQ